jgi:hypothetical protein
MWVGFGWHAGIKCDMAAEMQRQRRCAPNQEHPCAASGRAKIHRIRANMRGFGANSSTASCRKVAHLTKKFV